MANYLLDQTGEEVQAILNAVQAPDTTPVAGSTKLITSGGVQAALTGTAQELDDKVTELGHKVTNVEGEVEGQNQEIAEFKETITNQIENFQPIVIEGNVTNAPDEEDLTTDSNDLLKFANRGTLYGKGYKIFRRGQGISAQFNLENTIYEIRYDVNFNGGAAYIPKNSILVFNGGKFSNGKILLRDGCCIISAGQCFSSDFSIGRAENYSGVAFDQVEAKWFGAIGDYQKFSSPSGGTDNTSALQAAINSASAMRLPLHIGNGCYKITDTLQVPSRMKIIGVVRNNQASDAANNGDGFQRHSEIAMFNEGAAPSVILQLSGSCDLRNIKIDGLTSKTSGGVSPDAISIEGVNTNCTIIMDYVGVKRCRYGIYAPLKQAKGFTGNRITNSSIQDCYGGIYAFAEDGAASVYHTDNYFRNVTFSRLNAFCIRQESTFNISNEEFDGIVAENIGTQSYYDAAAYSQFGSHPFQFFNTDYQGLITIKSSYIENIVPYVAGTPNSLVAGVALANVSFVKAKNCEVVLSAVRFANCASIAKMEDLTRVSIDNCIHNGCNVHSSAEGNEIVFPIVNNDNITEGSGISIAGLWDYADRGYPILSSDNWMGKSSVYVSGLLRSDSVNKTEAPNISYNPTSAEELALYVSNDGGGSGLSQYEPTTISDIVNNLGECHRVKLVFVEDINLDGTLSLVDFPCGNIDIDINGKKLNLAMATNYAQYIHLGKLGHFGVSNGEVILSDSAGVSQSLLSLRPQSICDSTPDVVFDGVTFTNATAKNVSLLILYKLAEIIPFITIANCTITLGSSGKVIAVSVSDSSYNIARCKNQTLPQNLYSVGLKNIDGQAYA